MATITLRSVKGSPLTNNEVDGNFTNLNTDKYESGSNISVGTVTASSNLSVAGTSTLSISATVSSAGNDQAGATALTATYNIVTGGTATSADGVKLPDCAAGLEVFILNTNAFTVDIFPASGEQIDGGTTNAAIQLAAKHSLRLVGVSATNWNRLSPVIIYDSSGTRIN